MSTEVVVPALGESVTEATVAGWLKNKLRCNLYFVDFLEQYPCFSNQSNAGDFGKQGYCSRNSTKRGLQHKI